MVTTPPVTRRTLLAALTGVCAVGVLTVRPPTAAGDDVPAVTRREPNAGELTALVEHIRKELRGDQSDADLLKDLDPVVFAFDYKGGPARFWLEVEETGQKTLARRLPEKADDWRFAAKAGHVCFAVRRNVSERVAKTAAAAGKKVGVDSAAVQLIFEAAERASDDPKGSANHVSSHIRPVWYAWQNAKVKPEVLDGKPKPGEATGLYAVNAGESTEGVKEPRKVKLTLKAVFGDEKKDK
jgi:hypothetical protein